MNANAQKWVEALRSGGYTQGKGVLHKVVERPDGPEHQFCCLGVACEVARENGVPLTTDGSWTVSYDHETMYLPQAVQDWLGLNDDRGCHGNTSLAVANDSGLHSLEDIANVIEEHAGELFRPEETS